MRVVVIGAGLAGLAAACHLTGRGYEVTVVEREDIPGGRNGQLVRDGFTFDTGPTVLTMRDLVADALRAVDADLDDLLPMRRLDPAYRAQFADGSTIRVRYGREAMRNEIADTCGSVDAAAFDGFVDWLQDLYVAEMPHFIDRNFDSPLDLLVATRTSRRKLVRLGGFGRLGNAIRRRFRDDRLHRLFSFQAMYAGLAPDEALAIYAVITYMDSIEGVWFPDGGMHAMPVALATAAEKAGTEFRYGASVSEVLRRTDTGGVAGVRLDSGEQLAAEAVVCTLDLPTAYEQLLPDLTQPRALRRPQYSPSAVVWHVGVRGLPEPDVAHHNIHFGAEWGGAFDDLLKRGTLMGDASRLVTIPSLDDPTLAPDGCSTLFVLEPVPNLARRADRLGSGARPDARAAADLPGRRGLSHRRGDRGAGHSAGLAATGDGRRDPVRPGPHLRPDRSVPTAERGASGARPGLRRLGYCPWGRGADGAHLREAGRRSGRPVSPWRRVRRHEPTQADQEGR